MIEPHLRVQSLTFDNDSLVIVYMAVPGDMREAIVQTHQIRLSLEHTDYAEDADALQHKAVRALKNALEDFTTSEPYDLSEVDDDTDDDRGMGE